MTFLTNYAHREGEHFVSGGEDKLVKLWGYDEGINTYSGAGHSGAITRVCLLFIIFRLILSFLYQLQISPDQRSIVSVGAEGAIFIWSMPDEVVNARADNQLPTISKTKHSDNENQGAD